MNKWNGEVEWSPFQIWVSKDWIGPQVSTSEAEVEKNLRDLSEPIRLFGEEPADRRNRLREDDANEFRDLLQSCSDNNSN